MSSSSHQENAARLLDILNSTADVQLNDESTHGLFGDLYSGHEILEALIEAATTTTTVQHQHDQDNVGMPSAAVPDNNTNKVVIRSFDNPWTTFLSMQLETVTPREMPLEIHNLSHVPLRVRWINQQGGFNDDTHQWTIQPQSTFEQYCQPGHLFVLSVVVTDTSAEQIVGAYRPRRPLPSLTAHAVLFQEIISSSLFVLETLLLDATKFDALTVAAADLDHSIFTTRTRMEQQRERLASLEQMIHLLQTIVKNVVLHHPNEEKYHRLKLANSKMKSYIVDSDYCWGAMEMLTILGFVEKSTTTTTTSSSEKNTTAAAKATTDNHVDDDDKEEEQCLVMATPTPQATLDIGQHALQLLDILQSRVSAQFVAELAPPTPWQAPPPLTAVMGSSMDGQDDAWTADAGHHRGGFVTAEERWARAERVARLRRSGGGRMPSPGNAPSSRGKWGR